MARPMAVPQTPKEPPPPPRRPATCLFVVFGGLFLLVVAVVLLMALKIIPSPFSPLATPYLSPTPDRTASVPATPTKDERLLTAIWTEIVTPTPPPTETPTITPTVTQTPTPTETATPTATPTDKPMPYVVRTMIGMPIGMYHRELDCEPLIIGGQVVDLQDEPVYGVTVALTGTYDGQSVNLTEKSGDTTLYGDAGFEFPLPNRRIKETKLFLQLLDENGGALSAKSQLPITDSCAENAIIVTFKRVTLSQ